MKTSSYFEQTLFYRPNPATDQRFQEKIDTLFQVAGEDSYVEIHDHVPVDWEATNGASLQDLLDKKYQADVGVDDHSISEPPSPVDHLHYEGDDPPRYNGAPGLRKQTVSDPEDLEDAALVRLTSDAIYQQLIYHRRRKITFVYGPLVCLDDILYIDTMS